MLFFHSYDVEKDVERIAGKEAQIELFYGKGYNILLNKFEVYAYLERMLREGMEK